MGTSLRVPAQGQGDEMKLGFSEWWATQGGGDRIVWAIVVVGFVLYFTGNLQVPR